MARKVERPDRARPLDATFTRRLRWQLASEEERALVGSHAISFALAILFLVWVYTTDLPASPLDQPEEIRVTFQEEPEPVEEPVPTVEEEATEGAVETPQPQQPRPVNRPSPRPQPTRRTEATAAGDVGAAFEGAFGGGGAAGNVAGTLRGVEVAGGGGPPGGGGTGKVAIEGGGTGGRTPGRGGITGSGAGTGEIGRVGGGAGVSRGSIRVSAPSAIDVPPAGRGRNMGDLGAFVRSRQNQLRFCYEEQGLKVNPNLAGTITVAISIQPSGAVSSANVTRRTWGGAGASSAESCILGKIRSWRFPSADVEEGTYSFPFNFTT